jgi:hypothetical protein
LNRAVAPCNTLSDPACPESDQPIPGIRRIRATRPHDPDEVAAVNVITNLEDYLDTMRGLTSGDETEIDPQRPGDVQAFRDVAQQQAERGVDLS